MTSLADHKIWQDVYHVPSSAGVLYVKFTVDEGGKLLLSFKPKKKGES
jgi:motility quorum-sensing regulator/GCU-specific mRNA interferase toxin